MMNPSVRELELSLISHTQNSIWHSTYFTQPAYWRGHKVLTVYDMIYELLPEFFGQKFDKLFCSRKKRLIEDADIVVCISETTRQDIAHLYNTEMEKLHCIYLAYNAEYFYQEAAEEINKARATLAHLLPSKPFLLYVGSRGGYKNFSTLLTAYSAWHYRNEIALVVVGSAWSNKEKDIILAHKLELQTYTLSDVNDDRLRMLYNAAEAFVYPSIYEGFGIPLLEAMACGCPIVASRIPSSLEIAQDYPIYCSPSSTEELQVALSQAIEEGRNDQLLQKRQRILPAYSWDKTAQSYLDIYTKLM